MFTLKEENMAEEKIFKIKNTSGQVAAGSSFTRGKHTVTWQDDGTIDIPECMLDKFLKNPDNKLVGQVGGNKPENKVAKKAAPDKLDRAKGAKRSIVATSAPKPSASKKVSKKSKK